MSDGLPGEEAERVIRKALDDSDIDVENISVRSFEGETFLTVTIRD